MKSDHYIINQLPALLLRYLEQSGFQASDFELQIRTHAKERQMTTHQLLQSLGELEKLTANPTLGLEIAKLVEPVDCGVFGYLVSSCEDLGEASVNFKRYQHLLYRTLGDVTVVGDHAKILWTKSDARDSSSCADQILMAGIVHLARSITGVKTLAPLEVGFFHSEPEDIREYISVFGKNIHFESNDLYVTYPLSVLDVPIIHGDPGLKQILLSQMSSLENIFDQSDLFENKLQSEVIKALQDGSPNLPALSNAMNIPIRTLQRHLASRGLSFRKLLDNTRKELSIEYLVEQKMPLVDTSFLLGYSEQSAFNRAFKRWHGISPRRFQQQHIISN